VTSLRILLLSVSASGTAQTVTDHVKALIKFSKHEVYSYTHVGVLSDSLPPGLDLTWFDVLVIHYSVYTISDDYLGPDAKDLIGRFKGTKVLFVQDEYRQINTLQKQMSRMGIDILFTCVPAEEVEKVYPSSKLPALTKVTCLTGYVPERLLGRNVSPIVNRHLDVGYRARKVPYWLGELGAEKWQIVPRFLSHVDGSGLICDLSYQEEDRIYGRNWVRFVGSCRTMLGAESGASVFDFTGDIQTAVDAYVADHPDAVFEDVRARFLAEHEGRIRLNQISPRCFEAAALRTGMVLYEGSYSGILHPWRHYIPLQKNYGNISQVIDAIKNAPLLQEMVDRTYSEIALDPANTFATFVRQFDAEISDHLSKRSHVCRSIASPSKTSIRFLLARIGAAGMLLNFSRFLWKSVPSEIRRRARPFLEPILGPFRGSIWGSRKS